MGRLITGTVVSDKANNTIVVSVNERKTHPLYKKQYTVRSKYMAHDAKEEAKLGDRVVIAESRPISAQKRFVLKQVIERSAGGFVESDATADVQEPKIKEDDQ
jgi:small subunit ribosomal protein S17